VTRRQYFIIQRCRGAIAIVLAVALMATPEIHMPPVRNKDVLLLACLLGFCVSFAFAWHSLILAHRILIRPFSRERVEGLNPELIEEIERLHRCCPDAHMLLHYPISYLTNNTVLPIRLRVELEGHTFHIMELSRRQ
jgi:hypothetical protein